MVTVSAHTHELVFVIICQAICKSLCALVKGVVVGDGEHIYPQLCHIVPQGLGAVEAGICGRLYHIVADKRFLIEHGYVRRVKQIGDPCICVFKIIVLAAFRPTPCRLLVDRRVYEIIPQSRE